MNSMKRQNDKIPKEELPRSGCRAPGRLRRDSLLEIESPGRSRCDSLSRIGSVGWLRRDDLLGPLGLADL